MPYPELHRAPGILSRVLFYTFLLFSISFAFPRPGVLTSSAINRQHVRRENHYRIWNQLVRESGLLDEVRNVEELSWVNENGLDGVERIISSVKQGSQTPDTDEGTTGGTDSPTPAASATPSPQGETTTPSSPTPTVDSGGGGGGGNTDTPTPTPAATGGGTGGNGGGQTPSPTAGGGGGSSTVTPTVTSTATGGSTTSNPTPTTTTGGGGTTGGTGSTGDSSPSDPSGGGGASNTQSGGDGGGLSSGAIAGIAAAGVIVLLGIAAAIIVKLRRSASGSGDGSYYRFSEKSLDSATGGGGNGASGRSVPPGGTSGSSRGGGTRTTPISSVETGVETTSGATRNSGSPVAAHSVPSDQARGNDVISPAVESPSRTTGAGLVPVTRTGGLVGDRPAELVPPPTNTKFSRIDSNMSTGSDDTIVAPPIGQQSAGLPTTTPSSIAPWFVEGGS